jgi:hypothetical protein
VEYRNGVLDGLLLIAAGTLLLAHNLDMLPTGFWWALLGLWPVLLVLAGLDVVAGHIRPDTAAYLLYAVEVMLLIMAVWIAWSYPSVKAPDLLEYFPFTDVSENMSEAFGFAWQGN